MNRQITTPLVKNGVARMVREQCNFGRSNYICSSEFVFSKHFIKKSVRKYEVLLSESQRMYLLISLINFGKYCCYTVKTLEEVYESFIKIPF